MWGTTPCRPNLHHALQLGRGKGNSTNLLLCKVPPLRRSLYCHLVRVASRRSRLSLCKSRSWCPLACIYLVEGLTKTQENISCSKRSKRLKIKSSATMSPYLVVRPTPRTCHLMERLQQNTILKWRASWATKKGNPTQCRKVKVCLE